MTLGCSVWGCIAYDAKLNRLYCPTGNGVPDLGLGQTPGWANGLLSLDATTGAFKAYYGMPPESNYRDSDIDVDVGASPTLFDLGSRRVVAVGCKNGSFHVLDADTLAPIKWRQLLPTYNDGTQIPTVDPHPSEAQADASVQNPRIANRQSDDDQAENYSGIYSTAAVHPPSRKIFVGIGGNNYHSVAAGIDTPNTPFMRALDYDTLADAWPVDNGNPPRYTKARPPLYTNSSESGSELSGGGQRRCVHGDHLCVALCLLGRRRHRAVRGPARRADRRLQRRLRLLHGAGGMRKLCGCGRAGVRR